MLARIRDGPATTPGDMSERFDAWAQRADEIEKVEPKMAYYCRMYAVDAVRIPFPPFLNPVAAL